MNASINAAAVDTAESRILTSATARHAGSSLLGALAIAGVWMLVLAAVLFGVLAPLNTSFACGSAQNGELTAAKHSVCEFRKV